MRRPTYGTAGLMPVDSLTVGDLLRCRRIRFLHENEDGSAEWIEIDADLGEPEREDRMLFVVMMLDVIDRDAPTPEGSFLLERLGYVSRETPQDEEIDPDVPADPPPADARRGLRLVQVDNDGQPVHNGRDGQG